MELFLTIVGALGVGAFLSTLLTQIHENKRQEKRDVLEREKLGVENMRWVSTALLSDIIQGVKKINKLVFELNQAVYTLRSARGLGIRSGPQATSEELEAAYIKCAAVDGEFLDTLNEASVYFTDREESLLRELLYAERMYKGYLGNTGDPEYSKYEPEYYNKFNDFFGQTRKELRFLLSPGNLLARLSNR